MKILLGITGSIAAYKSAELIRRLQDQGHEIQPLMTKSATAFITPLTIGTLANRRALVDIFDNDSSGFGDSTIDHIEMVKWADAFVIAPATANTIAKLANGLADDMVSTTFLCAQELDTYIAPAMNPRMWQHPVTQENLARLSTFAKIIPPVSKTLACGETGEGAMAEVPEIVKALKT